MPRITHFEFAAEDMPRAKKFYEAVFGWKISQYPMPEGQEYWGIETGEKGTLGINGGLMKRKDPYDAYLKIALDVDNIDKYLEKVQKAGGVVTVPKYEIAGVGWMAYFRDTEGVVVGLFQSAPGHGETGKPEKKEAKSKAKK